LSHYLCRYLAQVKAGTSLTIGEHGRVVAVLSPASDETEPQRPRPRVGGYRSDQPLSPRRSMPNSLKGFGDHDRR
jgi:antitoxin (DNA-binding transcriptional repressor) of toxin-antitoxin stability system